MKKRIRQLLEKQSFDEIANQALRKRRVLNHLVSLTFDKEPEIGWRAVEAMGITAERIAPNDPDRVQQQVRHLYWLITEESGGICWRSPEAMAEIVRRMPELCAEHVPIIVSLLREMAAEDLAHFRVGILWAIGRLGPIAKKELAAVLPDIQACLDHEDSQVRGMAAWCLGQCGREEMVLQVVHLLDDEGPVEFYKDGSLSTTTVGDLVRGLRQAKAV